MSRLICCFLIFSLQFLSSCVEPEQKQILASFTENKFLQTESIYSTNVKDSFLITVLKPVSYNDKEKYHHVYVTDGSLGIGEYILGKNESWKATVPANCIIIAVSQPGDWEAKRTRDFIPSDISGNEEKNFGKAKYFYLFLKNELIPAIEKQFPNKRDRSFIGHSFGGLFCLYTLFQEDKLFDRHFAISPAIWANYFELDKIEEKFSKEHRDLHAEVIMYAGGLEFLNKVLPSTRSFYNTLEKRNYNGLKIEKEEISNANHFSIRKPAVDKIFDKLKD